MRAAPLGTQRVILGICLILAVCAFVPSAIWILEQPWHTGVWEDDDATIELLTRDAGRGRHWIGPYSRFRWNHPGPIFFYAVWPVYWLSGGKPAAARLVPLFINVGCAVGIVWIVRRYFGSIPAVIAGAGVAIIAAHLGASIVASLWNPYSTIMPFALFVCLALGAIVSGADVPAADRGGRLVCGPDTPRVFSHRRSGRGSRLGPGRTTVRPPARASPGRYRRG